MMQYIILKSNLLQFMINKEMNDSINNIKLGESLSLNVVIIDRYINIL